jgi:hypothetical protein
VTAVHPARVEPDRGLGRDGTIDAVRAVAMVGVVGGHWLVTGFVVSPDGVLRQASPLAAMPWFAPVSWGLQTLGLFFFAGGFAAARSAGRSAVIASPAHQTSRSAGVSPAGRPGAAGQPVDARSSRPTGWPGRALLRRILPAKLVKPIGLLAGAWTLALAAAAAAGVPSATLRTVALLVVSPLWFLLPYLALGAATGPLIRLIDRAGPAVALAGVATVALTDLGLLPGWLAVPAAWSVPWVLGVALARGRLGGAGTGLRLALGGAAGLAYLMNVLHYPASAVGVPGDGRSNLDPPSLFAIALATAQIGVFLMVREPARRFCGRPAIAGLNRAALPIYLSHQSVLVVVAGAVALVAPKAPGLLTAPGHPSWALQRLAWLPVLAVVLAVLVRFRLPRKGGDRHAGPADAH